MTSTEPPLDTDPIDVERRGPLAGVRVLELSSWVMVPSAGAVLADWGATVIKVENADRPDPVRGNVIGDLDGTPRVQISLFQELVNRGKRSIALDVSSPAGRKVIDRLLQDADVFITNLLPEARRRLALDVHDVRTINPRVIYGRGTGQGARGPEADLPAFDHTSFWARSGLGHAAAQVTGEFIQNPGPGLGDIVAGLALAGGIAAALHGRTSTGEPSVVDVSLLATAMWAFSPAVVASEVYDIDTVPRRAHADLPTAFAAAYLTKDQRFVYLAGVRVTDDHWRTLCSLGGREALINDERFATFEARQQNPRTLIAELDDLFATKTAAEWAHILTQAHIAFSIVQSARELHVDKQVIANHYLQDVKLDDGQTYPTVFSPVQFDETVPPLERSPHHGEHSDEVLHELGFGDEEILEMRIDGALW